MKTNKTIGHICILLVLLLSACSSSNSAGSNSAGAAGLEGTSWVATDLDGTLPISEHEPTLKFEDGQISGTTGCNQYGGSYQIDGNSIEFGELFNTEMACVDPAGLMDQEQQYLELLRSVNRFELVDGELTLFIDQQAALRLRRE